MSISLGDIHMEQWQEEKDRMWSMAEDARKHFVKLILLIGLLKRYITFMSWLEFSILKPSKTTMSGLRKMKTILIGFKEKWNPLEMMECFIVKICRR